MNFDLSEEQNLLIQTTRSFVRNELIQHEKLIERTNNLPKELYAARNSASVHRIDINIISYLNS
jgi:hypothetical protein